MVQPTTQRSWNPWKTSYYADQDELSVGDALDASVEQLSNAVTAQVAELWGALAQARLADKDVSEEFWESMRDNAIDVVRLTRSAYEVAVMRGKVMNGEPD